MEEIRQQVQRARRRLIAQQFLSIVVWSLFAALCVAVIAVVIPKIWVIRVESDVWMWSWFGGALAVGLVTAMIWTYVVRRGALEAAIEIDRRFGLKERVSSALALAPQDLDSDAGKALLNDASQRVAVVDVSDQFKVSGTWRTALPIVPAVAFFLIAVLIAPAQPSNSSAKENAVASKERIKKANDELKKKIEAQIKKAEDKGLKDAEVILKELDEKFDKLSGKDSAEKKETLLKLNDLKSQIRQERDKLGGADKMRKQFDQLKNIEQGPADKMAASMKEGDFQKAMNEVKELQKQLESGEMTAEQKAELAKQLDQMREAMQEMKKAHEQAKKDLEKKIQQAKAAGDKQQAEKLAAQLDQMTSQDQNMQQMQEMADKLGQCSQALKSGDAQKASDQLGQMARQLQQLQQELDQLESLDEMIDEIASAKDAMNCKECGGEGCSACQGNKFGQFGSGNNQMGMPGRGMGRGQGRGDRPEAETDTGEYLSRVGGKPQAGEAIRTGEASGPNVSGKTKEGVKQEIQSALTADSDPLSNQSLPKSEAKHAKEYFEKLRNE
jgi:hypothetical protein